MLASSCTRVPSCRPPPPPASVSGFRCSSVQAAESRWCSSVTSSVTVPKPASTNTSVPSANSWMSFAATIAGRPSCRARIAVCDWGPPSEVTSASTRLGSRVAVSAGARSIAVSTNGSSLSGIPGACSPRSSATMRARTSRTSAARSAMYPPRPSSMVATWSPASQTARAGDLPPEVTKPCAVCVSEGSAAICAVASRIFFPSPAARAASRVSEACTAAAAAGIRSASTAASAPSGSSSPTGGSATGGAIARILPMTRPGLTATPVYCAIEAISSAGGGSHVVAHIVRGPRSCSPRRVRDSNPRCRITAQWFSRPSHSAALTTLLVPGGTPGVYRGSAHLGATHQHQPRPGREHPDRGDHAHPRPPAHGERVQQGAAEAVEEQCSGEQADADHREDRAGDPQERLSEALDGRGDRGPEEQHREDQQEGLHEGLPGRAGAGVEHVEEPDAQAEALGGFLDGLADRDQHGVDEGVAQEHRTHPGRELAAGQPQPEGEGEVLAHRGEAVADQRPEQGEDRPVPLHALVHPQLR